MGEWKIERIQLEDLGPEELAGLTEAYNRGQAEISPRAIHFDPDSLVSFMAMPHIDREHWIVRDDGRVVGYLLASRDSDGANADTLRLMVWADPDYRRRGIGSALTVHAARIATEEGRVYLQGEAWDSVDAGMRFVGSMDAEVQIENHSNFVRVADLDREMLERWRGEGPGRAPDYDLDVVDDGYPDEYLEGVARMLLMLEKDAPMPEGREPRRWTGDMVKSTVEHMRELVEISTAVATHHDSGSIVGLSQLLRPRAAPRTMITTWTVVDRDHRGHALGKWLKAAVILRALGRWPDAVDIETMNAFSNDAMLGINHEIGFAHEFTARTYRVPAQQVLDRLG